MKLIIAFLLPIILVFNQLETDNFEIHNGKLIWQKIYETKLTKNELIGKLKSSGSFKNIKENENGMLAEIENLSLDFKGYGSSEMSTPMYITRNSVNSFIQIEFKEERYRVTIKNIKLIKKYDDALSKQGEITDIEVFALKKRNTKFKTSFLKKPAKIINFTFEQITKFKKTEKDKW